MRVSEERITGNATDGKSQRAEDSSSANPSSISSNLKAGRQRCYAARDAYYACVDGDSSQGGSERDKGACKEYRVAFEASCAKSWVHHFDSLREKEARVYRRIQDGIVASEKRKETLGRLQGQGEGTSPAART